MSIRPFHSSLVRRSLDHAADRVAACCTTRAVFVAGVGEVDQPALRPRTSIGRASSGARPCESDSDLITCRAISGVSVALLSEIIRRIGQLPSSPGVARRKEMPRHHGSCRSAT